MITLLSSTIILKPKNKDFLYDLKNKNRRKFIRQNEETNKENNRTKILMKIKYFKSTVICD